MKRFTRIILVLLAIAALSTSVSAEGFEGVISMTMTSPMPQLGGKPIHMSISIKGMKSAIQMEMPQVGSMKVLTDRSTEKTFVIMEAMKMGMEIPKQAKTDKPKDLSLVPKPTGEKKNINGYYCERYTAINPNGIQMDMWLTNDLPKNLAEALKNAFGGAMGAMSRNNNDDAASVYADLFNSGKLPVQVDVKKEGSLQASITYDKFEQKSLSDDLFVVPSDITIQQMPAMPGGGQ